MQLEAGSALAIATVVTHSALLERWRMLCTRMPERLVRLDTRVWGAEEAEAAETRVSSAAASVALGAASKMSDISNSKASKDFFLWCWMMRVVSIVGALRDAHAEHSRGGGREGGHLKQRRGEIKRQKRRSYAQRSATAC